MLTGITISNSPRDSLLLKTLDKLFLAKRDIVEAREKELEKKYPSRRSLPSERSNSDIDVLTQLTKYEIAKIFDGCRNNEHSFEGFSVKWGLYHWGDFNDFNINKDRHVTGDEIATYLARTMGSPEFFLSDLDSSILNLVEYKRAKDNTSKSWLGRYGILSY